MIGGRSPACQSPCRRGEIGGRRLDGPGGVDPVHGGASRVGPGPKRTQPRRGPMPGGPASPRRMPPAKTNPTAPRPTVVGRAILGDAPSRERRTQRSTGHVGHPERGQLSTAAPARVSGESPGQNEPNPGRGCPWLRLRPRGIAEWSSRARTGHEAGDRPPGVGGAGARLQIFSSRAARLAQICQNFGGSYVNNSLRPLSTPNRRSRAIAWATAQPRRLQNREPGNSGRNRRIRVGRGGGWRADGVAVC